jgi:hypothetical protein
MLRWQQRAVVRRRARDEAALEVLGDRHDRDAEDAALAAARVVDLGRVDERHAAVLEGRDRVEAVHAVDEAGGRAAGGSGTLVQPLGDEWKTTGPG